MLGKIQPEFFPKIFGPQDNEALDSDIVKQKFQQLSDEVFAATGQRSSAEEIAEGFIHIAVSNMANAIKKISIERGYDVSKYTLASSGGAGGQHACLVAEALGISPALLAAFAALLAVYGMGLAGLAAVR